MTGHVHLGDLDLAALISSRICHDIISPVGAISNGLEVLDEETDEQVRAYAMDLIRRSTEQASAKLQFARLAFGAAGSAGSEIDMQTVEQVTRGVFDPEKHALSWFAEPASMPKDKVKLLLNLAAIALTTLPRGGTISVKVTGSGTSPVFDVRCLGDGVRLPENVAELMSGQNGITLDTFSIQPYYASRVATAASMKIGAALNANEAVLSAVSVG